MRMGLGVPVLEGNHPPPLGGGLFLLGRCDCCPSRIWLRLKFDSEAFEGHIRSDLSG